MRIKAIMICLLCCFAASAQKTVRLTVSWQYVNVEEGYDHDNKMVVFVDGKEMGESDVFKETERGTYTFSVKAGLHDVRIVNYALYEGDWEEHTRANNYSIDAVFDRELDCYGQTINLLYDIESETAQVDFTGGSKTSAKKTASLRLSWQFVNIVEGYDHKSRMKVYIDGELAGTSKELLQSKKGTMTVKVAPGMHHVRIVSEAFYEGRWEEHTQENEYSVDAYYEETLGFVDKQKRIGTLVFDIDSETATVDVH